MIRERFTPCATSRSRRFARGVALGLAVLIAAVTGCRSGPLWRVPNDLRLSDRAVAAALDDLPPAPSATDAAMTAAIPSLPILKGTRPCCAFGTDLKTQIGKIPLPGYSIENLREVEELGPHRYDNGMFTLAINDERGWADQENNGLVYTCRGGFIDTAHVREYADLTVYLTLSIARVLATGGVIPMKEEGGERLVRVAAVDPELIAQFGRRANDVREGRLAAEIAAWLAYQSSIWHEIATWYGYRSVQGFPEKLSAFSPEDLYSNQVGVRIARAILLERGLVESASWDRRLDVWLRQVLYRLGAVDKPAAERAIRSVDGSWWDSRRRVPDWRLVRRREFGIGPVVHPVVVPDGSVAGCDPASAPLPLEVREGVPGLRFADVVTLETVVSDRLVREGLPLGAAGSRQITQGDFPRLVEAVRAKVEATLDAPDGAPAGTSARAAGSSP